MGDFLEKFRQARSEMDSGSLSRDISFQGDPFEGQVSVPEYQDPEEQAIINRRLKTGGTLVDAFSLAKRQQEIDALRLKRQTESKAKENLANRSEFTRGLLRGVDTLQATYEGGLGMYNAAMGDQAAANQRFANYQEQMRQAQENPATVTDFFSTDPKTGAFASPGNFGTYVAGTLGQAVPSLTEAVASGIAGAAIGAAIVPAPDPADVVTIPAGAIGGFLGRNAMKRAIASAAQQYAQRGVAQDVAEQMADRYVRQAVANRIATNIGSGLAVSQTTALHEGGGMYAEGLEKGYNAPGTAIALGQFSGLSESLFGAAPTAVKAIIGKAAVDEVAKDFGWKTAAGYLWETIKGAGEEGVQEGFQELLGSINQEINDPNFKINSKETFMQWAEAAAAGAVTGGVVGGGGAGLQAIRDRKRQLEQIRAKGFVSESDAKQAGIDGASRRDRMANLEAERQDLDRQEQEIVGQQQVDGMQVDESGQFVPQVSQADIDREFAERMAAQGGNVTTPAPALPPESVQTPAQQNPFEVPSVQAPQAVPVQQAPGGVNTRGFDVYGQQPSQPSSGNPFEFGAGSTPAGVSDVPASENPFEQPTAPPAEPAAEQPATQAQEQPTPLYEVAGDENMVARVWPNPRGFLVNVTDMDSGEVDTRATIFPTFEQAKQHADTIRLPSQSKPQPAEPAAEQPEPSLTPEQQVESDRQFAEQKAAEQGSIAPQAPVIKQRLKNAVRFAPDTVIPEGVPSVRRTHPVFGDYIEVSTAYVGRIPGYSANIESQGAGVKPPEQQPAQVEAPEVPVAEQQKEPWEMSQSEAQAQGWGDNWSSVVRRAVNQKKDVPFGVLDELNAYDKERESKAAIATEAPKVKVGDIVVRYTHKDGTGLLNNNGLDRSKLTDEEESELTELMDFGLQQPAAGTQGTFYFTKDGEQKHRRMLELLKKASKTGIVRTESTLEQEPSWESSDGQIAVVPKQGRKKQPGSPDAPQPTSDIVSPAAEVPASDIDAMMEDIMSQMGGLSATSQQEQPRLGRKKPKEGKRGKKSERTKAQAANKREQAKQAMLDAFKDSQGRLPSGLDIEVATKVAKAAKLYIEAGALEFKAFVENLVEDFGDAWVRDKKPYLESAWRTANKLKWVDSPAGSVDDILPASKPAMEKVKAPGEKQSQAEKESEVDKTLRQAGLKVERLADGTWQITGNTYEHSKEIGDVKREIRELGGFWDKYGKRWTFKADPRRAIADRLVSKGVGAESSDAEVSDEQVARERARREEDAKADVQTTRDAYVASVDQSTRDLIGRGLKFGMTDEVVNNQIEDIGRVVVAAESGLPMFVIGSAPGTGKTFVLGGVIRELRRRGFKKFVYVTQNEDLVSQVQKNLADYGLEGVEFVTYAKSRTNPPSTTGSVLLLDEAHTAKNLGRDTGKKLASMVQSSDFTVYATATPFENVTEAEYIGYSGIFDDLKVQFDRPSSKPGGRPFRNELYGFKAWAWMFGANVYFVKQEDRSGEARYVPIVWWDKQQTSEEDQLAANEWLKKRGVYVQRPMALPLGVVNSELRSVEADPYWADISNKVVQIYADAESEAENNVESGQIKAHKANVLKRLLEASKVDAAIARAKDLIGEGKKDDPQVIIFVNTKADTDIGTYTLSEPYRKEYGIKGKEAKRRYTPSEMDEMMQRWYQAKAIAKQMGDDAGPPPFAPFVHKIAMAMDAAGVMEKFPSVIDKIMDAFPGRAVEYSGRTASQNTSNLAKWKNNEAKLIVATMDKGGTGLSFHDTTGTMPSRYQVNMNLPWSGTKVEQVSGRLARYGTAKPVNIEWIFANNIPFDRELSKTVGSRMRSMAAAVQGRKSGEAKQIREFDFEESQVAPDVAPASPWFNATVEDEGRWAGTSVNVSAKGKEDGYAGKVVRVLNKGETIEVQRDGFDAAVRVPAERVSVVDLVDSKPVSDQQSDKAAKILADMESNQEKMRQEKKQREGEKLTNWVKAFEGSPREVAAAKDLFRKDFEKARENGVSDDRLMEIIDHGAANEMFTEREAEDLKARIRPNLKKERHKILLERAMLYMNPGESYKRDIADPAMRLQLAIAKGNPIDSSLVQTLADELEVRLDYWEPILQKAKESERVINETWGDERTFDKAVERKYQADRLPIVGKAMQEEKVWYQTQDKSLDDKIQAWLDGGELPTRVYGDSSGMPMDLGSGESARKRAQSLANKLGVGVAIVQHAKTFKAFFVELPVSNVDGLIYGSQAPLNFDEDYESISAAAPDAGKEKRTILDNINDELLGVTKEKVKNDLIAKAAEDLGSEVQPKKPEVKDEARDQEEEQTDSGSTKGDGLVKKDKKRTGRIVGSKTKVGQRAAHYEVVEIDQLVGSHYPFGMAINDQFPEEWQKYQRRYESLSDEQKREVWMPKDGFDPSQVIDTTRWHDRGPTMVVEKDGKLYVVGGTRRYMMLANLYRSFEDKAMDYHNALVAEAEMFGLDVAAVNGMDKPILIRVIDEPGNDIPKLVDELNADAAFQKDPAAEAASLGRGVGKNTIAILRGVGDEETLAKFLDRKGVDVVYAMVSDNPELKTKVPSWVKGNSLTKDAKLAVQKAIMGAVISDATLINQASPRILQSVNGALAEILLLNQKGGEWSLSDRIKEAITYDAEFRVKGKAATDQNIRYWMNDPQMTFLEEFKKDPDSDGYRLWRYLLEFGGARKFRNALQNTMLREARLDDTSGGLFADIEESMTGNQAFDLLLGDTGNAENQLDASLRNPPETYYQTEPDIDATIRSKALDLGIAANKQGITQFEDFIAYAVDKIGEAQTRRLGNYLTMVGQSVGMKGVRPTKDVLGVPMTQEQYVQLAKETFASVPAEQVEAGIEAASVVAIPQTAVGFSPAGSPVPGQGLMQGGFDQPADYEFTEGDYRPAVVAYARDKWGSEVAANGKPTWQNFVRWFDDSAVVDEDGKPLVVYHGGAKTIDDNIIRTPFFYMTANKDEAQSIYPDATLYEFYVKMSNPHQAGEHLDNFMDWREYAKDLKENGDVDFAEELLDSTGEALTLMGALKARGNDGIIMPGEVDERYKNYLAFNPSQIKSATGNVGTFGPSNPNMLHQNDLSGIDAESIPKTVLNKMSRRLKSMGYDSRGAEDVRKAIKEKRLLDFQEDWIAAYRFAVGAEQDRQGRAKAKKDLKHINWNRLSQLGETLNPSEAGYIKPDGSLADFSGKREGGQPGTRSFDHREAGGTAGMQEVIAYGWVRMDENSGSLDIAKMPTPAQLSAITRMAQRKFGEIVLDLEDGLGEWRETDEYYSNPLRRWSQQYPEGTKPQRIINDIKRFFSGDTPNTLYQRAYHGSPYKFSKFTLDHIGKGEGAQMYGWGLYFADKRQVADYYREMLAKPFVRKWTIGSIPMVRTDRNGDAQYYDYSPRTSKDSDIATAAVIEEILTNQIHIESAFAESGLKSAKAKTKKIVESQIETWKDEWPEAVEHAERFIKEIDRKFEMEIESPGAIYQVEIPESEDYLLWDKPMTQQSEKVKDALRGVKPEDLGLRFAIRNASGAGVYLTARKEQIGKQVDSPVDSILDLFGDATGMTLYFGLANQRGVSQTAAERWASEFLAKRGVKGIKYLDQNSRFATADEKSFNYVIFDASDIVMQEALFQQQSQGGNVKGWTKFISGTRALIGATSKADVSTVIHEFAHPIRRFLLDKSVPQNKRFDITDEEIEMLEKKCGAGSTIDGKWVTKWDVPAEENFARMWEQYWFDGESPNSVLDSLFAKISRWMQQVYSSITAITGQPLDPEVRKLFDKLVQRGLTPDQRAAGKKSGGGTAAPVTTSDDPWKQRLTSIANQVAELIRLRLGVPGLTEPSAETFKQWLDEAKQILSNDPTYAERLVKELAQSNRNVDNIDVAVLQIHFRHLNNQLEAASDRLFKAKEENDSVAAAKARLDTDLLVNQIEEFTDITKRVGTEAGRALVARKIALQSDFTLGSLLRKARIANAGEELSEDQIDEITELSKKIAELEGQLEKEIQKNNDLERRLAAEQSIEDTKKEVGKPVRNTATNRASSGAKKFVGLFASIFGKKTDTGTLQQTEDEKMAEAAVELIQGYVDAGVYTFGDFMARFKRDIGMDVPMSAKVAIRKAWDDMKSQGDIPAPEMQEKDSPELRRLARTIQRSVVEAGIVEPDEVIDAVHESLQEVIEDITKRETMDAMSGYGQYSTLSPDPIDGIIRDLNGQYQQMAKLDDMRQGMAPKKTGGERRTPSDKERELIQQVNQMKRNSKYFITDPESQLKSIFQSTRTALRNRIYDLSRAINVTGTPIPGREGVEFEAEQAKQIAQYRKLRDELMAEYKRTFPRPGLTFEQRAAIAERAADRAIAELEKQLASGDVSPKGRPEPISTPSLEAKRNRLVALRAERDAVREMQNPKMTKEERDEKAYVANLLSRIADYEDRMQRGYFGPRPKKPPRELSPREKELSKQLENIKDEFFRYAAEYRLKNMTPVQKAWDYTKETMHLSRAIMTSFDLSAVFRQGGIASFAHPKLAASSAKEMYYALRDGQEEFNTMDKISKDDLYAIAMQAGLSITTDSGKITRQEEAYMGRWAKWGIGKKGTKINKLTRGALIPVSASARAYTTFLNSMRFRLFKHMVSNLGAGGQVTLDEAKVIASYVNAATGRAELGKFNQAAANLNMVFFAPRYVASRFQYLAMPFYLLPSSKVSGRVKKMIAMEYARFAIGVTSMLGLSVLLGSMLTDDEEEKPTVEFDPRSSDFMKLKIGETRIDPMAGLSQTVTLIGQLATGQKKGLRGDIQDLYGEKRKFGDPDLWDVTTGFLRKKLAPIPGAIVDLRVGENVIGEKETPLTTGLDLFVPLSFQEAGETFRARGLVGGAGVVALSLLGMGGGTYGPRTAYATGDSKKREELFKKDLERVKWDSPDPAYKDFLTTEQLNKFNNQREGRKQALVYAASADPKRKEYVSDESFKQSIAERDKALDAVIKAGMGYEEIKQLLIGYYKRNYGSAYETRGGNYQMKESLTNRLRAIRRKMNEKQPANT